MPVISIADTRWMLCRTENCHQTPDSVGLLKLVNADYETELRSDETHLIIFTVITNIVKLMTGEPKYHV